MSLSFGPRGASVNVGKRGSFLNTGIPGTGLYARQRIGNSEREYPSPEAESQVTTAKVAISLADDGSWTISDSNGLPVSPEIRDLYIRQNKKAIAEALQTLCDNANSTTDALCHLHWSVPDPAQMPTYQPTQLPHSPPPKPLPPTPKTYSLLDRLSARRRAAVDESNEDAQKQYAKELEAWRTEIGRLAHAKVRHDQEQDRLLILFTDGVRKSSEALEELLDLRLKALVWPRETNIDFEVADEGRAIGIDVDLPEIEDMPDKRYVVLKRDLKVEPKPLAAARLRELYMGHVHCIGLRLIGEIFHGSPQTELVIISGYTQRVDRGSGHVGDQYLYTSRISRAAWMALNWADPRAIDPVSAFAQFETRRKMSKTGVFQPIEPFVFAD